MNKFIKIFGQNVNEMPSTLLSVDNPEKKDRGIFKKKDRRKSKRSVSDFFSGNSVFGVNHGR